MHTGTLRLIRIGIQHPSDATCLLDPWALTDNTFMAHSCRVVLEMRCPSFLSHSVGMDSLHLPFSHDIILVFLQYLYTGSLSVDLCNAGTVYISSQSVNWCLIPRSPNNRRACVVTFE